MSMFSAMLNCLGLDMGSSQVRIYQRDKVLLEEASTAVAARCLVLARRR